MASDRISIHVLRKVVIDAFVFGILAACLCVVNLVWQPFQRGFFCGDESLMLPFAPDTVSVPVLRAVGIVLPSLFFIVCEWLYLRGEPDSTRVFGIRVPRWLRGLYCVAVSFALALCISELLTEIAKNTIGRLRPHFFEICQPSVNCSLSEWQGRYILAEQFSCTSGAPPDRLNNARKSFLSGHSSWAATSMIYLALYLERRKVCCGSRLSRHVVQFAALALSWYVALSRVSDYRHHWSDVLAGYALGALVAVLMFLGTDWVEKQKEHAAIPQSDLTLQRHISPL